MEENGKEKKKEKNDEKEKQMEDGRNFLAEPLHNF